MLLALLFISLHLKAAGTLEPAEFTHHLVDPGRALQVDSLNEPSYAERFTPIPHADLNLGYGNATHWFRITPPPGEWLLELAYSQLDEVSLYSPEGDKGFRLSHAGDMLPFSQREIAYHYPIFRLTQPGGEHFFLRIRTKGSIQIPLRLWSPDEFTEITIQNEQAVGLYFGAMLVMILYNLFLFVSVRDRNYLRYVLYIGAFLLFQGSLSGYSFQYLWPDSPGWANHASAFFIGLAVLTAVQFSRHFLESWKQVPRLDYWMQWIMSGGVLCMLLIFVAPYKWAILFAIALGMAMVLVVLPAGYLTLFRGYRPARYFVLAWSTLLFGIFINGLIFVDLVPINAFTVNVMPVGSLIEVVLLSLALADRINRLRQEKEEAQADFNRELRSLNQSLELQVARRTDELRQAKEEAEAAGLVLARKNRELEQMASHDMLTGLLNRRAFREQAELLLADGARYGYPVSLMMVDVDYFKSINDNYGHQLGDRVLADIGKLLRRDSRSSDRVARYGGEEFILLLPHARVNDAMHKAERLRRTVAAYRFEGHDKLTLSASFGVSSTDREIAGLDELISRADAALYRAKHQGRNRVCLAGCTA